MDEFEINDMRGVNEFKGITFSKFKKTDAKKELLNSLKDGKIENALNWSAEFICSGAFIDLWDILLNFIGKHIHLGNPKLPIYLDLRFNNFKEIIQCGYIGFELNMRNNNKIRKLFGEIIIVLCKSQKKHSIESIKIQKASEFDMTTISTKLKAPNVNYATELFKKDDPKELFIGLNEFMYHLSKDSLNSLDACYWMEWILEFENMCKKKKEICICERRSFVSVEEKFQKEPIWMIWDAIFISNIAKKSEISKKILKSIFDLFCIRYTSGAKRKRKYLIYFAISLITEKINDKIPIINDKSLIDNINKKINLIYKEIKKNEVSPAMDYLFTGVEKSNREKTVEKLETMNKMNTIIRN
jgi:hypothetical protein|uniref:Uncharacterized protein n=1 Tax=viral metagenome TaxID=1070528 RepID=A0A6C0CJR8_9ZZZZ